MAKKQTEKDKPGKKQPGKFTYGKEDTLEIRKPKKSTKKAFLEEVTALVRIASRFAESPPVEEETEPAKGKPKGPPPMWEEYLKALHQGGKERVPNPNAETKSSYPRVQFTTALRDKAFLRKALEEYHKWLKDQGKGTKKKSPPKGPWRLKEPKYINPDQAAKLWDGRETELSEEREAIRTYTGQSYLVINSTLRKGEIPKSYESEVAALDAAMKKSKAKQDFSVYRTVSADHPLAKMVFSGTLEVGTEVVDKGFVSTTVDKSLNFTSGGIEMVINVPKGYGAVWVGEPPDEEFSKFANESEIILDRDTTMVVAKVEGKRVYMDVQPKKKA